MTHSSPSKRVLAPICLIGLLWAGLTGLDWFMRFHWFNWHRTFISGPAKPRYMGDARPLASNQAPAKPVGDLARMLADQETIARYAIENPEPVLRVTDEFGLPNVPPTADTVYPILLAGDSFMLQGAGTSNFPGARLSRRLGRPVYTVAHAGRGPVYPLSGAMQHPYVVAHPPEVVIWCVAERDATGHLFDSMAFELMAHVYRTNQNQAAAARLSIAWDRLRPASVQKSLPNTSAMAQQARRLWSRIHRLVPGKRGGEVLVSESAVGGHPMLFYAENLKALFRSPEASDVPRSRRAVHYVQTSFFKPKGITWVVVLIPEKEQVYREHVPPMALPGDGAWPPSILDALAEAMQAEGVRVVNLLPVFRGALETTPLLYWPDDTHWNEAGMELAVESIYQSLEMK